MPIRIPLFFLLILIVGAHSTQCLAVGFMDRFVDPEDGMFDTSEWLLTHRGFLPVPMIITEPAVDNGLGLGLAFFHEAKKTKPSEGEHSTGALPPSISAVFGAATGNDSWFAGGGHWGSWKNDSIRYLGGAGLTSVNLKFYGGGDSPNLSKGLKYNLDGWFLI